MLDKINKYLNLSLIISGVMAILGVVLMVYPEVSFTVISYVIGISFLAAGVSLLFIERVYYTLILFNVDEYKKTIINLYKIYFSSAIMLIVGSLIVLIFFFFMFIYLIGLFSSPKINSCHFSSGILNL